MEALPLQAWLAIAEGAAPMPAPFQRFIAAWELIVAWHRTQSPGERNDAALKRELKRKLKELELSQEAAWRYVVGPTLPWEVIEMQGTNPTGQSIVVREPEDTDGIVDALYMVRCNLLKAGKNPDLESDRLVTAVAANVTAYLATRLHNFETTNDSNADSNLDRR